jgi:hypothetical protein
MLLGGMSVIGAYVWASEASFKATSPAVLSQVSTISFSVSLVCPYANAMVQSINRWLFLHLPGSACSYHAFDFRGLACELFTRGMPSFRLFERFPMPAMAVHPVRGCSFTFLTVPEGAALSSYMLTLALFFTK